ATSLGTFSTGQTHGDGRQASHWKDNLALGIMDPTAAPGEQMLITNLDRQAMDVIGWTPANTWSWIDPAGGTFTSPAKWVSTIVPTSAQNAIFNLNSAYTISFTAPAASASTQIRGGSVTFAMGGSTF